MTGERKTGKTAGRGGKGAENSAESVRILAFLCNWCSYAGADLAGVSRLQYPSNVIPIRVMCTGTVSPHHMVKAFQVGFDGVLIAACHLGDCHYLKGNYMTYKRFRVVRGVLDFIGIDPDRIRLEWVSAAEGEKFAKTIEDFTERIRKAGPSPLRERWDTDPSRWRETRGMFRELEVDPNP